MGELVSFADHNDGRWLEVRLTAVARGEHGKFAGQFPRAAPAWYVVRTCPCCRGELVTIPLETRDQAETARTAMIEVAKALSRRDTPKAAVA
jgi:hypothetical protein